MAPQLGRRIREGLRLRRAWREALGEHLAKDLAPGPVEGGCLVIFSASPAWLTEARFLERRILDSLQAHVPDLGIERIELRLDDSGDRQPAVVSPPPVPMRPVPAEEREAIQDIVSGVADPTLRGLLARVFEKVRARQLGAEEEEADGQRGD